MDRATKKLRFPFFFGSQRSSVGGVQRCCLLPAVFASVEPCFVCFLFFLQTKDAVNKPSDTMCGILGIFGSGLSETELRAKLIECSKM